MVSISDEEDLFLDEPAVAKSSNSESAAAKRNTSEVTCVICFDGYQDMRQCKKCFVKICVECRSGKAGLGRGEKGSWCCSPCCSGGAGLEALLQMASTKKQKVTRKGNSKAKYSRRRRFRR